MTGQFPFYVGTYTKYGGSDGIYHGVLDGTTGEVRLLGLAAKAVNPTFVALHPNGRVLYSVLEENGGGAVCAFAILEDGTLRALNSQSTLRGGNCHLSVDASGKTLFAASYGSGTIASLPIAEDGSIGSVVSLIEHRGSGPDLSRQSAPHAHGVYPRGGFVYACDLGTDDIFVYRLDSSTARLTPNSPPSGRVAAGGGARHLAFHPSGKYAYVNSEMSGEVTVFAHDAEQGTLRPIQSLSTLPADYAKPGDNLTAEIHCSRDGRFVYVSNRGHDSIAVFAVAENGTLALVEIVPAGVKIPRGFGISPDGLWLIAAGQSSNDLALHRISKETGKLSFVRNFGNVGAPVNVEFFP